ncbi:MAG: AIM24 family protein [Bradymonadaceae bacterium]
MTDAYDDRDVPARQGSRQPQQSSSQGVMDALQSLESDELARYCRSASIEGAIAQTFSLELNRSQKLWASKGSLISYDKGIDWNLEVPGGAGKAVSRMLSGESLSLTRVTAQADGAQCTLGSNKPGKLVTWDLSRGAIKCTKGAFVAALGDVDIDVTVAKRAGAALFGGAGLFMQRLSGEGIAVLHGSGDFIEHQLDHGETMLVSTGNLACFSDSVSYDVTGVGGCGKMIFGSEGMFMTEVSGPGWVMLQSLKDKPQQAETSSD